ncbi:hypothetical protein [Croceicoccus gelatinilyticus]|uniref:hypothetical protein n=1 Tax=Croceicoccus gelatinilyticus TaxID=2835536 RepID=UPI001BD1B511|nr:hypothetical protein [Croceicoccus gelatinilyticus]MBS7671531.1 hypothetical protein [Croceicoccus gelatinilyticus]
MNEEFVITMRVRVIDEDAFNKAFKNRVISPPDGPSGFDPLSAQVMTAPDRAYEVLIGSSPDVSPNELGLEIVDSVADFVPDPLRTITVHPVAASR